MARRGPQRQSYGEFPAPLSAAHEQQGGDISARAQQKQCDCRHQQPEESLQSQAIIGVEPQAANHPKATALIRARIVLLKPARDGLHLRLDLFQSDAGFESPKEVEPACAPVLEYVFRHPGNGQRLHSQWEPKIDRRAGHHAIKISSRDTNNGEVMTVEVDFPSDHAGISAESPLPETIAQHCDRLCAWLPIIFRQNEATERRPHTERRKVIACDQIAPDPVGRAIADAQRRYDMRREAGKRLITVTIVEIIRVAKIEVDTVMLHSFKENELVRVLNAG